MTSVMVNAWVITVVSDMFIIVVSAKTSIITTARVFAFMYSLLCVPISILSFYMHFALNSVSDQINFSVSFRHLSRKN